MGEKLTACLPWDSGDLFYLCDDGNGDEEEDDDLPWDVGNGKEEERFDCDQIAKLPQPHDELSLRLLKNGSIVQCNPRLLFLGLGLVSMKMHDSERLK